MNKIMNADQFIKIYEHSEQQYSLHMCCIIKLVTHVSASREDKDHQTVVAKPCPPSLHWQQQGTVSSLKEQQSPPRQLLLNVQQPV